MRKLLSTFLLVLWSSIAYCDRCTSWEAEFAEISFLQDSLNPMTIHLVCKVKAQMHCDYDSDYAVIIWGDGFQSLIPLVDTAYLPVGFDTLAPLKTYRGSHTYSSPYADSIVQIGMRIVGVNEINNTNSILAQAAHMCPISAINFSLLKTKTNFKPPAFPSFTLLTARRYHTLLYTPEIIYDTSYTLRVENIWPISFYPDDAGEIFSIADYPLLPTNIVIVDSTTGNMNWTSPLGLGPSMLSYRVSLFKNGVFVCNMTRNFEVNVLDTLRSTGVSDLLIAPDPIHLFPNPATDYLHLSMTNAGKADYQFSITDLLGQEIYSSPISQLETGMDISNLSKGIYIWHLSSGSEIIKTGKIVKD